MTIFFKSAAHKQRFLGTINQIGKIENGKLDPEYAAALYILTASSGSWLKAAGHVSRNGIEFEEIQATAYSSGEQFMVLVAWSLFNGHQSVNLADLSGLDRHNFRLALDAMQLRYRNWSLREIEASSE